MRGPIYTRLGEDIRRSSLLAKFLSEFRYLAAFSNAGGSKSSDVKSEATFRTFEISGSINEASLIRPNLHNTFDDGRTLHGC